MTSRTFRCSDAADAREEPLYGTASIIKRWLLIEQPGSWGRDALMKSRMPVDIATELRRRAWAAGVRIILIRRGVRLSTGKRQCYFIRTDETDLYQSHLELDSISDLLDIDLSGLRGGVIAEAKQRQTPLFLICTHGKHDACCSRRGNQVSRVACAEPDLDVWECSHIGGDRFAANLVCYPHGYYYGRVGVEDVFELMTGYTQGVLSLDHYRGRCCYTFAVQAAEYFARRESLTVGVDEVSLLETAPTATGLTATLSLGDHRRARVEVAVSDWGQHLLTCTSTEPLPIPRYDLVGCIIDDV